MITLIMIMWPRSSSRESSQSRLAERTDKVVTLPLDPSVSLSQMRGRSMAIRSRSTPLAYALPFSRHAIWITCSDNQFKAMSFAMLDEDHKQPTKYKLVVVGEEEKVVGLHIIGEGSDEIMQGCECLPQRVRDSTDV